MTITRVMPAGAPYWARTNTFAHYGGDANKAEFAGVAALGGDTDLSAADFNRLPANVSACARTAPFCVITYTGRESTSADPLVSYVALPTGIYIGDPYDGGNPPTGFPSVTRFSGTNYVTFDSSYSDAYGVSQSFTPKFAKVTLAELSTGIMAKVSIIDGQKVYTLTLGTTGLSSQDHAITLEVW